MSLVVGGALDGVLKLVAQYTVEDMEFERPSLEEIFLTYYSSEGEGGAP